MDKGNLDGQDLIFLSQDDVSKILKTKTFEAFALSHYEILAPALHEYREYSGVEIALMGARGRYQLICFVSVCGKRYRVHIEDVICEHCGKMSGISGTPGVWNLYQFCEDPHAVHSKAMALPVKKCIHCSGLLNRRHTIWFEHEQCS